MYPGNIRFLPLLFVVLALSVRAVPDNIAGDEQTRKTAGSRYYWCCALPSPLRMKRRTEY